MIEYERRSARRSENYIHKAEHPETFEEVLDRLRNFESPIEHLKKFENADIFLRRDDKIPFSFGGNKVLMACEIFADIKRNGYDTVISYGSPSSNMNRAIAKMASFFNIPCVVIIKRESEEEVKILSTNEQLVKESAARIVYCERENVAKTVDEVMKTLKAQGKRPYYIYGDILGRGNERVLMRAFVREYVKISSWENQNNIHFDYIFLPVGTGITISGLFAGLKEKLSREGTLQKPASFHSLAGESQKEDLLPLPKSDSLKKECSLLKNGALAKENSALKSLVTKTAAKLTFPDKNIIFITNNPSENRKNKESISLNKVSDPVIYGISIARDMVKLKAKVKDNFKAFYSDSKDEQRLREAFDSFSRLKITDDYICGGYSKTNRELISLIQEIYTVYGIPLDPVYTGKAFYGMLKEIKKKDLKGNCLFIHTGGYPIFEDAKKLII